MSRSVALLPGVLVIVAGSTLATATPAHAAQGVTVRITQLPGEFVAGGPPAGVTVVAGRSRGGCEKLRWSLVLRTDGIQPDQVRVDRIEESGSFPVDRRTAGTAVRVTDRQLDPGTLCRDRTVTARYAISVVGGETGARLTLAPEARSAGGQLLDRTTVTRELRPAEASPSPEPAAAATAAPSGAPARGAGGLDADRASDSSVVRVGPIGLAVGAVMVLLGLALLVRVRRRSRRLRGTRPALTLPPIRR
jgi:hypothetical protein